MNSYAIETGKGTFAVKLKAKPDHGGFIVNRRAVPGRRGLYQYKLEEPA